MSSEYFSEDGQFVFDSDAFVRNGHLMSSGIATTVARGNNHFHSKWLKRGTFVGSGSGRNNDGSGLILAKSHGTGTGLLSVTKTKAGDLYKFLFTRTNNWGAAVPLGYPDFVKDDVIVFTEGPCRNIGFIANDISTTVLTAALTHPNHPVNYDSSTDTDMDMFVPDSGDSFTLLDSASKQIHFHWHVSPGVKHLRVVMGLSRKFFMSAAASDFPSNFGIRSTTMDNEDFGYFIAPANSVPNKIIRNLGTYAINTSSSTTTSIVLQTPTTQDTAVFPNLSETTAVSDHDVDAFIGTVLSIERGITSAGADKNHHESRVISGSTGSTLTIPALSSAWASTDFAVCSLKSTYLHNNQSFITELDTGVSGATNTPIPSQTGFRPIKVTPNTIEDLDVRIPVDVNLEYLYIEEIPPTQSDLLGL